MDRLVSGPPKEESEFSIDFFEAILRFEGQHDWEVLSYSIYFYIDPVWGWYTHNEEVLDPGYKGNTDVRN
jgi:hypothetical protein